MNNIIFRKGALIENDIKKNKWVMHFRNMSGDADHYEELKLDLDDTSKFLNYIIIYATRWIMTGDVYNIDKILAAADIKGIELGMESGDGYDLYMDLTGPDVTNDQWQATPEECWITYFDEIGYEHMVEIVKGDKVFYRISETNIKEVLNED